MIRVDLKGGLFVTLKGDLDDFRAIWNKTLEYGISGFVVYDDHMIAMDSIVLISPMAEDAP